MREFSFDEIIEGCVPVGRLRLARLSRGLLSEGERAASPESERQRRESPWSNLKASLKRMDPDIRQALKRRLRERSAANLTRSSLDAEEEARRREFAGWQAMDIEAGDINTLEQEEADRDARGTGHIFEITDRGDSIDFEGDPLFRRTA